MDQVVGSCRGYPDVVCIGLQAAAILAIWYDRLVTWADKKRLVTNLFSTGIRHGKGLYCLHQS
jgi:hypothetical protein